MTTKEFITEATKVHGSKYDYSATEYINSKTKVSIICPKHGTFEQRPIKHLKGQGCPLCCRNSKLTTEMFIERAKEIHGDKYDYSLVEYKNNSTKVKIICPEHGIFEQRPSHHLAGCKCPKCSGCSKYSTEDFIKRAKEIHGDKYDYSLVEYVNNKTKVKIICPFHGVFEQVPTEHLSGSGCIKCRNDSFKSTKDEFVFKGNTIHNNKYDYSNVDYINSREKIKITCPIHGDFEQCPDQHLLGDGCPYCAHHISKGEQEVFDFIKSIYNGEVLQSDRKALNGKELDIYIPELKLAIEYTGLRFHSKLFNNDNNHLFFKFNECQKQGIKLITLYEDEWLNKKDLVKSMISHHVGNFKRIFARKTEVRKITDVKIYSKFLNENHIQGTVSANFVYGLYFNEELVSVMTFTNPRLNMGRSKSEDKGKIELSRFCNKAGYVVVGGASKLLKAFINSDDSKGYTHIYSYSDNRISNGDLYKKIKFNFVKDSKINYFYTDGHVRKRKQGFRKSEFSKRNIDISNKTESQLAEELGFYKIFDCGKKLWELGISK